MSKEKQTAELKRGEGNFYHCCDYNDAMEIINVLNSKLQEQAKEIERLKGNKISVDEAGVLAINVVSNVRPKLTTQEETMFIAGFQECIKYLTNH